MHRTDRAEGKTDASGQTHPCHPFQYVLFLLSRLPLTRCRLYRGQALLNPARLRVTLPTVDHSQFEALVMRCGDMNARNSSGVCTSIRTEMEHIWTHVD